MRQVLALTFEVRHLPLSDGQDEKNFGKGMMNFDWDKHAYSPPKRVKSEPGQYKNPSATAIDLSSESSVGNVPADDI